MRKIKILGKVIPVWLLVLAIPAMAILVNYLSNTITYTMTIQSPFKIQVIYPNPSEDELSGDFGTVYGGSTIQAWYSVENRANNPITVIHEIVVFGPSDLNGSEITEAKYSRDGEPFVDLTLVDTKDVNGDGKIDLIYHSNPETYDAESWEDDYINFTFNPAIEPGDYSFTVTLIPG